MQNETIPMRHPVHTDNVISHGTLTRQISIGEPDFKSPSSNPTTTILRVDSMESTEHLPHTQSPDVLDAAGKLDEIEGLMMLQTIIFGILGIAIFGAAFTLVLIAS